jgi:uncharacterized protein
VSARRREETGKPGETGDANRARKAPRCPICGKPTVSDYRPFCSRRCADIDLGRWLKGRYAVPGEPSGIRAAEEAGSQDDEDAGC